MEPQVVETSKKLNQHGMVYARNTSFLRTLQIVNFKKIVTNPPHNSKRQPLSTLSHFVNRRTTGSRWLSWRIKQISYTLKTLK